MALTVRTEPVAPAGARRARHLTTELVSDSLVYRYDVDASPDGLAGDEATFSLGSFPQAFTHLALISAAYDLDRRPG